MTYRARTSKGSSCLERRTQTLLAFVTRSTGTPFPSFKSSWRVGSLASARTRRLVSPVERCGINHEKAMLEVGGGRDLRDHVDEMSVIGNFRFHVRMRPIRSP